MAPHKKTPKKPAPCSPHTASFLAPSISPERRQWCQTKILASASAPALAMKGWEEWKATSWMASSCFFLWAVISCTHVLLSSIHKRTEQSWPVRGEEWEEAKTAVLRGAGMTAENNVKESFYNLDLTHASSTVWCVIFCGYYRFYRIS